MFPQHLPQKLLNWDTGGFRFGLNLLGELVWHLKVSHSLVLRRK
jgi:hypothetical protein